MNGMLRSLILLAFLLSLFMGTESFAQSFIYNNFSDTSQLSLNESATTTTTVDGDVLRLASSLGGTGSAFTLDTFSITSFQSSFAFRITEPSGDADVSGSVGGDGFAFVIQAQSSDSVGGGGGFLGYDGIIDSVAVEFDTWRNGGGVAPENDLNDPDSNHVGITTGGSANHGIGAPFTSNIIPDFDDGNIWYAWIDYSGNVLDVRLSQSPIRPLIADISRALDIGLLIGDAGMAYIGFTAGTAGTTENFDILNWKFTESVIPPTQYTITTNVNGNGSIILDPVGGTYDEGTEVTITASPDTDYQFDHWEGSVSGDTSPLTVTVDSDMSVTAVFTTQDGSNGSGGGGGCFISLLDSV